MTYRFVQAYSALGFVEAVRARSTRTIIPGVILGHPVHFRNAMEHYCNAAAWYPPGKPHRKGLAPPLMPISRTDDIHRAQSMWNAADKAVRIGGPGFERAWTLN